MKRVSRFNTQSLSWGFTLIEMLIVVSVIGIGLIIGVPRVRAMIMRQQIDRTAQIVASDIRAAFTSAARGRVPVRIVFSPSTTIYAITNRVTGDTILRRDFGNGDLRVAGVTGSIATMDVFPNGIATGADTITIAGTGYSRTISVSRVGFVRVMSLSSP
jgi:prepilin-type N-terminal cleavage/methylation domain-containing protein